jgi:hypothetical protein
MAVDGANDAGDWRDEDDSRRRHFLAMARTPAANE